MFWYGLLARSRLKDYIIHSQVRLCWILTLKDRRLKPARSPYYTLWISEGSKRRNCNKIILKVYLAPTLETVKKCLDRFCEVDFKLNDQPRSSRPSDVSESTLLVTPKKKRKFPREQFDKTSKIDISTAIRYWKRAGFVSKIELVPHSLKEQNRLHRISVAISF